MCCEIGVRRNLLWQSVRRAKMSSQQPSQLSVILEETEIDLLYYDCLGVVRNRSANKQYLNEGFDSAELASLDEFELIEEHCRISALRSWFLDRTLLTCIPFCVCNADKGLRCSDSSKHQVLNSSIPCSSKLDEGFYEYDEEESQPFQSQPHSYSAFTDNKQFSCADIDLSPESCLSELDKGFCESSEENCPSSCC